MAVIPEPLRIPDFRAFWLARLTTTIGQMAMVIVIGWQVYDIARATMDIREAAFQLGLIGLVQFVPLFVLTPISGWTADRLDRRHVARAVILLEMICALIPLEFRRVMSFTSEPSLLLPKSACSTRLISCACTDPARSEATSESRASRE